MKRLLSDVPKVRLEERHIQNCILVLDREEMLRSLGQRDIVAELGVDRGEFSARIIDINQPKVLHLVDTWGGGRYNEKVYASVTAKFTEQIDTGSVYVHRKMSTDESLPFPDKYFDLIYIDTCHTYEGTNQELLAYAGKMKDGGVIAGHDYTRCTFHGARFCVIDAVHEFCVRHGWELIYITAEPMEMQSFALRKI